MYMGTILSNTQPINATLEKTSKPQLNLSKKLFFNTKLILKSYRFHKLEQKL